MKRSILPVLMFFFFSLISVNTFGLDKVTKSYSFKDFSSIDVSSGMYLSVTQSESFSIEIKAEEKDFKDLEVVKKGSKLEVYFKKGFFNFGFKRHGKVEIYIKMPVLKGLDLSGGAHGNIEMKNSSVPFSADMSGGAYLEGSLTCGNVSLDISGGSKVNLKGKGYNLKLEGSGGCTYLMKDFSVNNVDADLSGGSHAAITMNGTLNADLNGGSRLVYYGNMTLGHTDFSGGSGVSKGD